jgi:dihydroflavonol-4-reductase
MNDNKQKRLIIFGGAGFLGQHLTQAILEKVPGSNILILDLKPNPLQLLSFEKNKRVEYRFGRDITKPDTYKSDLRGGADVIFNLAGYISFWLRERKKMLKVNVDGVRALCETSLRAGISKIVHVSSVAAIGFEDDPDFQADETMIFDARKFRNRIYMLSKHLGEKEALAFIHNGLDVIVTNPGLLYGPGENGAVLTLFRNISSGRLKYYPTGGTGVVDVRDAARGILSAMLKGKSGERYILNGYNLTFQETTATISIVLGKEPLHRPVPEISRIPLGVFLAATEKFRQKPPDLTAESFDFCFRFRYYSSDKAERELSWKPEISFEKTISDSADWYHNAGLLK